MDTAISPAIDACQYLYLRSLGEPNDNSLRLVIQEASVSPNQLSLSVPRTEARAVHAIKSTASSATFELLWRTYVAYQVLNEAFTSGDVPYESFSGRLLRLYTRSHFLDHLRNVSFAGPDHPGPLKHVRVVCLNHIIDVIAVDLPLVAILPT